VEQVASAIIDSFGDHYEFLKEGRAEIIKEALLEEERFRKVISKGMKEIETLKTEAREGIVSGAKVFQLYETYGFPYELTEELLHEEGFEINKEWFIAAKEAHQALSREGGEARFK